MKQETDEIRQADMVLACLKTFGEMTSRELKECKINKPANVIIKLKKRGYRIQTIMERDENNHRMAHYVLIERKPPCLRPERRNSFFWKRMRS